MKNKKPKRPFSSFSLLAAVLRPDRQVQLGNPKLYSILSAIYLMVAASLVLNPASILRDVIAGVAGIALIVCVFDCFLYAFRCLTASTRKSGDPYEPFGFLLAKLWVIILAVGLPYFLMVYA